MQGLAPHSCRKSSSSFYAKETIILESALWQMFICWKLIHFLILYGHFFCLSMCCFIQMHTLWDSCRPLSLLPTFPSCQHSWQLWRLRCILALNGLLNAHQLVLLWQYYNGPDNVQLSLSCVAALKANSLEMDLCNIKHLDIGARSDSAAVTIPTNEATASVKDGQGGKEKSQMKTKSDKIRSTRLSKQHRAYEQ